MSHHHDNRSRVLLRAAAGARRGGMSAIARDAGLSPAALEAWMAGARRPRPDSLRRIAEALDHRARRSLLVAEQIRELAARRESPDP